MPPRGRRPSVEKALAQTSPKVLPPAGTIEEPEPPEWLDPLACAIWREYLHDLAPMKIFVESDRILLGHLCALLANAQRALTALAGLEPGSPEEKRVRVSYNDSLAHARQIAGDFGMTPVARLRLGLLQVKGASLLGLLNGEEDGGSV